MNQHLTSKLATLTSLLASTQRRAIEVQTACQSQTFPPIDTTIRISAGKMASDVLDTLSGIETSLTQVGNVFSRKGLVHTMQKTYPTCEPDDLIAAVLATHEQALHSRCETLNRAEGMVEGTIGLWGQPIRRGPLWDK
ncbi:MAG: hypothetical protein WC714_20150 [Candidatus Obscuribacterales bacterium]|jgi:hypothetical protein